ncbi:alpha/beta hydrolase [Lysobacter sp. Root604]|uniref:alpha/beta fold hydrolase n=1 Tax=Lysobacter sp. Root604 TaxID=1736568 RepID=UPI0009EB4068|nr:alpha/beta hydrolase [Lysobacter sp. Root604]
MKTNSSPRRCVRTLILTGSLLLFGALANGPVAAAGYVAGSVPAADGTRIHYADNGRTGAAPALVFVPGWGMDHTIWDAQLAAFGEGHRVVAMDPRSQGASQQSGSGNTPEVRASDIEALLTARKLDRVVLIGWSQGVQDVAAYVERYGTGRIAGLVLVDAAVSRGAGGVAADPQAAQRFLQMMAVYAAHPREYLQGMMGAIFVKPLAPERLRQRVEIALRTPVSTGVAMLVADMYGVDRSGALQKFDRPTLIVAAASSEELAAQKAAAAQVPGASLEVIADAGHGVFVDQPEAFNTALREFLETLRR